MIRTLRRKTSCGTSYDVKRCILRKKRKVTMLEVLILFLVLITINSFLHMRGGKKFAPVSSLQGKHERVATGGLLGTLMVAVALVFMDQEADDRMSIVIIPLIVG